MKQDVILTDGNEGRENQSKMPVSQASRSMDFIDNEKAYLTGVSLKALGKKCFAFTKLDASTIRGIKKSAFSASIP